MKKQPVRTARFEFKVEFKLNGQWFSVSGKCHRNYDYDETGTFTDESYEVDTLEIITDTQDYIDISTPLKAMGFKLDESNDLMIAVNNEVSKLDDNGNK